MKRKLISTAVTTAIATVLAGGASFAVAQQGKLTGDAVKIGVLTDMSGVYADYGGPGAVAAAKMAVADFGGTMFGKPIEVVSADHQNKPDIAKNVAQGWFDRDGVDISVENLNSAVALAVQALGKEKNKITITTGAASARLTNADCAPTTGIHYLMDTIALSNVVGKAIVKDGGDSWYFLTADYAFGHSLEKDTGDVVKAAGGKVLGAVRHPLSTGDFSSFLLQAQTSGAKVVGLANAGGDTVSSVKAAAEFGLTKKQNLAALLMLLTDVHAIGLPTAQGLYLTEAWYWDLNAETARLGRQVQQGHERPQAQLQPRVGVLLDHALPQRGEGRRHRRHRGRDGQDEGNADQRHVRQGRQDPRRRPHGARHVPVPGQEAFGIQRRLGLLQPQGHHQGRRRIPIAGIEPVPRHQEVILG